MILRLKTGICRPSFDITEISVTANMSSSSTQVTRTASTSGKARPVLPPPPPPGIEQHKNGNTPTCVTTLDMDNTASNTQHTSANGCATISDKQTADNTIEIKAKSGSKSDEKSKNISSSSGESGGNSPAPHSRKYRPGPPPPKPPHEKLKVEMHEKTKGKSVTECVGSRRVNGTSTTPKPVSDIVHNRNSNTAVDADSETSILASKGQLPRNKLIVKPSSSPPQPPSNEHTPPGVKQSGPMSENSNCAPIQAITKPAILSPKPKIKPSAPPPPPNKEVNLHNESREFPSEATGAANAQHLETHEPMSDIMKDVLGVIDRQNMNGSQPDNETVSVPIVSSQTQSGEESNLTSETAPRTIQDVSKANDNVALSQDGLKSDQSSDAQISRECVDNKQTTDKVQDKVDIRTELTVDIPQTAEQSQASPALKPSVAHNRGANSPRRPVRRHKTALGLMLCCGLGRSFIRDKHSPPFELPLRTEGTLPRGNNVVSSTSLTSDLMRASHSPKQLEQSDVTASNGHVTTDSNDAIRPCNDGLKTHDSSTVEDKPEISVNVENHESAKQRDIIDAFIAGEKPIAMNKLQADNKYLVVTSENVSSSQTMDLTSPPVVHGVKLVKVEKSSTFSAPSSHIKIARPTTPRVTKSPIPQHCTHNYTILTHSSLENNTESALEQNGDVRLRKDSQSRVNSRDLEKVRSQSMEDLSCMVVDLDIDLANHIKRQEGYRSSFIGEDVKSKAAITRVPGEVQTLLKHSKEDGDKVYALPQPACYGDNTLRAVKLITDKYDTLERWKIRAVSFRGDGTVRKSSQNVQIKVASPSRQTSRESKTGKVLPEVTEYDVTDNSVDMTSTQSVQDTTDTSYGDMLERTGVEVKTHELKPNEMSRIRLFYCSRQTVVSVANSVVHFMLSAKEVEHARDVKDWAPAQTGVPVFVLNTGQGRRRRELSIILADRDTSFPLWTDTVNHLSQYESLSATMHTMHLSSSLMKIAAFQFHTEALSEDFMTKFKDVTKDPNDDLWKVSIDPKKVKKKKQISKIPLKGDISQPIQFDHVTSVSAHDQNLAVTLGEFIPKKQGRDNLDSDSFRQRAYSG